MKKLFKELKDGDTFRFPNESEEYYEKIKIVGRPENVLNLQDMTIFELLGDKEIFEYED